jgi:hypothetical protein
MSTNATKRKKISSKKAYVRPLVLNKSRKIGKTADEIIEEIIEVIQEANGVIDAIPIAHPDNSVYLKQIASAIDRMELYIRQIMSLTYKLYMMDSDNMELWRWMVAKEWFGPGAKLSIPIKGGRIRFYPENTIYFYLLANIHKHFDDYAGDKMYTDKRFFNILFMRMEELYDATGLYQMTPSEYEILFGKTINIPVGANFKGVNHEPNGYIGLANTALLSGFQISQAKLIDLKSQTRKRNASEMDASEMNASEMNAGAGRTKRSRTKRSRAKKNKGSNRKTRKRII